MKEPFPAKKARAQKILAILKKTYPDAKCALHFQSVFQLLVAVILSAQTNDKQVNKVTPELFKRFPDATRMAKASEEIIADIIRSIGFAKTKARNIQKTAQKILDEFQGAVPETMEDLVTLPGVGRKTANVVLETGFRKNVGVTVDTHVMRLSERLGFISSSAIGKPEKIEAELMRLFPQTEWGTLSHTLIFHGRNICLARRPKCEACPVVALCPGRRF